MRNLHAIMTDWKSHATVHAWKWLITKNCTHSSYCKERYVHHITTRLFAGSFCKAGRMSVRTPWMASLNSSLVKCQSLFLSVNLNRSTRRSLFSYRNFSMVFTAAGQGRRISGRSCGILPSNGGGSGGWETKHVIYEQIHDALNKILTKRWYLMAYFIKKFNTTELYKLCKH